MWGPSPKDVSSWKAPGPGRRHPGPPSTSQSGRQASRCVPLWQTSLWWWTGEKETRSNVCTMERGALPLETQIAVRTKQMWVSYTAISAHGDIQIHATAKGHVWGRSYVPARVWAVCGQCYHQKPTVWAATWNRDGVREPYCLHVDAGSLHCRLGPGWCLWSKLPLRTLSGSVVLLQPKVVFMVCCYCQKSCGKRWFLAPAHCKEQRSDFRNYSDDCRHTVEKKAHGRLLWQPLLP